MQTTDILWRSATISGPAEGESPNRRRVLMVSRTGNTVRRRMWDPDAERAVLVDEELVPDGFRASGHISFLDSHQTHTVGAIIGHVEPGSLRATDDGLEGWVNFDESDPRAQKILSGHAGNVSVGYAPDPAMTEKIKRDGQPTLLRVNGWTLRELSSVAVGADPGAMFRCRGVADLLTPEEAPVPDVTTPAPEARKLTAAEALQLRSHATGLGIQIADEDIAKYDSYERATSDLLARYAAEQATRPGPTGVATAGDDEADKRALSLRSDLFTLAVGQAEARKDRELFATHELLNPKLRGAKFRDIVVSIAERAGMKLAPGADYTKIIDGLLGRDAMKFRGPGPMGTTDLSSLLADVMHNVISVLDLARPGTFQLWSVERTFSDFRAHNFVRLDEDGGPVLNLPGEEVSYGLVSDGAESITAAKYRKAYAFTLEMLVNDALGGLVRYGQAWAARWAQGKNKIAYTNLLSNPTMADGNAFFHSSRGNIVQTSSASLPTPSSLESMERALANQVNGEGELIGYNLGSWLVAKALAFRTNLLLGNAIQSVVPTSVAPTTTGPVATYLNAPIVTDAQIDRINATYGAGFWYAVAEGGEPFIFGSVAGQGDGVESYWDWKTETRIFQVRGTFAHGAHNPRAMIWNTGVDIS